MRQTIPPEPVVNYLLDIINVELDDLPDRAKNSWDKLFALAEYYNIKHYLAGWVLEKWHDDIPNDLQIKLKHTLVANKTRNAILSLQIVKIARMFRKAGIPYLFIKGASGIVRGLYSLEQRFSLDLDVLVHSHNIERSVQLLQKVGYVPELSIIVPPHHHHIQSQCHPDEIGCIEIHKEPYDNSILDGPVMPDIWNDAETHKFHDEDITLPSISDHIWILLRTSGSGRMFLPRLSEAAEMALIIHKNYSVDYGLISKRAEKDNMANIVTGISYSCSQYMGIESFVDVDVDDPMLKRWEEWSLYTQRKLLKYELFKAPRKRFGALKFLPKPGIAAKIPLFKWFIRYEMLEDFLEYQKFKSFFPIIKLWRVVKNLFMYVLFSIEFYWIRIISNKVK